MFWFFFPFVRALDFMFLVKVVGVISFFNKMLAPYTKIVFILNWMDLILSESLIFLPTNKVVGVTI